MELLHSHEMAYHHVDFALMGAVRSLLDVADTTSAELGMLNVMIFVKSGSAQ